MPGRRAPGLVGEVELERRCAARTGAGRARRAPRAPARAPSSSSAAGRRSVISDRSRSIASPSCSTPSSSAVAQRRRGRRCGGRRPAASSARPAPAASRRAARAPSAALALGRLQAAGACPRPRRAAPVATAVAALAANASMQPLVLGAERRALAEPVERGEHAERAVRGTATGRRAPPARPSALRADGARRRRRSGSTRCARRVRAPAAERPLDRRRGRAPRATPGRPPPRRAARRPRAAAISTPAPPRARAPRLTISSRIAVEVGLAADRARRSRSSPPACGTARSSSSRRASHVTRTAARSRSRSPPSRRARRAPPRRPRRTPRRPPSRSGRGCPTRSPRIRIGTPRNVCIGGWPSGKPYERGCVADVGEPQRLRIARSARPGRRGRAAGRRSRGASSSSMPSVRKRSSSSRRSSRMPMRRVARAGQLARDLEQPLEQRLEVELGHEAAPDLDAGASAGLLRAVPSSRGGAMGRLRRSQPTGAPHTAVQHRKAGYTLAVRAASCDARPEGVERCYRATSPLLRSASRSNRQPTLGT